MLIVLRQIKIRHDIASCFKKFVLDLSYAYLPHIPVLDACKCRQCSCSLAQLHHHRLKPCRTVHQIGNRNGFFCNDKIIDTLGYHASQRHIERRHRVEFKIGKGFPVRMAEMVMVDRIVTDCNSGSIQRLLIRIWVCCCIHGEECLAFDSAGFAMIWDER